MGGSGGFGSQFVGTARLESASRELASLDRTPVQLSRMGWVPEKEPDEDGPISARSPKAWVGSVSDPTMTRAPTIGVDEESLAPLSPPGRLQESPWSPSSVGSAILPPLSRGATPSSPSSPTTSRQPNSPHNTAGGFSPDSGRSPRPPGFPVDRRGQRPGPHREQPGYGVQAAGRPGSSGGSQTGVSSSASASVSPVHRQKSQKGTKALDAASSSAAASVLDDAPASGVAEASSTPLEALELRPERGTASNPLGTGRGSPARNSRVGFRHPRQQLRNGSRDDSFLSTISESTKSSDSTSTEEKQSRDSKITVLDGSQIEVFSESPGAQRSQDGVLSGVLNNFEQLFAREGGLAGQQLLRSWGWEKPLEMQRRVVPLVMSAFTTAEEQKSFVTVQGASQCGKTSALVLGILGSVGTDVPGIRAVVLGTSMTEDFRKYFEICSDVHPAKLECFEGVNRRVSFEGLPPDPESAIVGVDLLEDLQRLSSALSTGAPAIVFGHPTRVLPLLREAPSWGVDLGGVQVLALDDAEETIRMGLMDEVCEVCTILRHFSKLRLRHILLSQFLSHEAKSMIRCLRNSLLRQQNLFGIRAHRTQARAKCVNHYFAVAPRARWPAMLAALHHALSLPSGIIFDDASPEARAQARSALRALSVTASVWNALQEQGSGARAAARDGAAPAPRGPAFHLMPSDLVVLKVDLPQVRCVLHFEVPRRELSIYGLRLMCLEQTEAKKSHTRKGAAGHGGRSLSVLFVEEEDVVRELEKTFHIRMQEVPTEMLIS